MYLNGTYGYVFKWNVWLCIKMEHMVMYLNGDKIYED